MHQPVLLNEAIDGLTLRLGASAIDATLGGSGHAQAILSQIGQRGRLLALDRDQQAVKQVPERLTSQPNVTIVHADFDQLEAVASQHGFTEVNAILLDLGVSSIQLDDPTRGFSFQTEGPLDMRLDRTATLTAGQLIARSNERQLADIFFLYGELYDNRRLAHRIVEARQVQPIMTTTQLVSLLGLKNPGVKAKVFQALRIAVNDELGQLERAIPQAVSLLASQGRLAIISFHSLEDRIVKRQFRHNHLLDVVTKKPISPPPAEIAANPRSRSAKLRIAQKVV